MEIRGHELRIFLAMARSIFDSYIDVFCRGLVLIHLVQDHKSDRVMTTVGMLCPHAVEGRICESGSAAQVHAETGSFWHLLVSTLGGARKSAVHLILAEQEKVPSLADDRPRTRMSTSRGHEIEEVVGIPQAVDSQREWGAYSINCSKNLCNATVAMRRVR